jgi:hypothetical protein
MTDWTPSQACPGYREKTIQRGAATIIIRRPIMDDDVRAKCEQRARETLGAVMQNYIKRKG